MDQDALRTIQQWLERENNRWLNREETSEDERQRLRQTQQQRRLLPLKAEARVLSLKQTSKRTIIALVEHQHLYQQSTRVFEEAWQEWIHLVRHRNRTKWQIQRMTTEQPKRKITSSQLIQLALLEHEEQSVISRYRPDAAITYAETYWDTYNSDYAYFSVNDCTNFVSQSLLAGGFPMEKQQRQDRGWWYHRAGSKHSWSYSWAVAHSFYYYLLAKSHQQNKVRQMTSPYELQLGDVICYDWEGDGRWDHNTIITMKDADGAPLVNAHTNNSRHRYWEYTDSAAWTPRTQYAFFHLVR